MAENEIANEMDQSPRALIKIPEVIKFAFTGLGIRTPKGVRVMGDLSPNDDLSDDTRSVQDELLRKYLEPVTKTHCSESECSTYSDRQKYQCLILKDVDHVITETVSLHLTQIEDVLRQKSAKISRT